MQHHYRRGDVESGERLAAPGLLEAGLQGALVDVRAVGCVPDREPAVGDLRGLLDALRTDGRDVDRDLPAVEDRAKRLSEPGRVRAGVRDLVVLAAVHDRLLARPDLPDDRHVFARLDERLSEALAVPALDHLRAGDAEAEEEAPTGELIE